MLIVVGVSNFVIWNTLYNPPHGEAHEFILVRSHFHLMSSRPLVALRGGGGGRGEGEGHNLPDITFQLSHKHSAGAALPEGYVRTYHSSF